MVFYTGLQGVCHLNRLLGMVLGVACVFLFPGLSAANLNKTPPEISIGTIALKGTFFCNSLLTAKNKWNEAHGTQIKVNVICGGVLGTEADMVRKMSTNTIEGAAMTALALRQRKNAGNIVALDLPRMTRNKDEYEYVLKNLMPKTFNPILQESSFHILAWSYLGHTRFFSTERVEKPEDLKKVTTFWWEGDPDSSAVWRENGLNISLSVSSSIATDMGKTFTNAMTLPGYAIGMGVTGKSHFVLTIPWSVLTGVIVVTENAWNAIPKELQTPFQQIFQAAAEEASRQADDFDKSAMEALCGPKANRGQTCVTPSPGDLQRWDDFAATLRQQSTQAVPKGEFKRNAVIEKTFLDQVEDALKVYRAGGSTR